MKRCHVLGIFLFFQRILVIEKSEIAKLIIQLVVVVDLRFDNEARLLEIASNFDQTLL